MENLNCAVSGLCACMTAPTDHATVARLVMFVLASLLLNKSLLYHVSNHSNYT